MTGGYTSHYTTTNLVGLVTSGLLARVTRQLDLTRQHTHVCAFRAPSQPPFRTHHGDLVRIDGVKGTHHTYRSEGMAGNAYGATPQRRALPTQ